MHGFPGHVTAATGLSNLPCLSLKAPAEPPKKGDELEVCFLLPPPFSPLFRSLSAVPVRDSGDADLALYCDGAGIGRESNGTCGPSASLPRYDGAVPLVSSGGRSSAALSNWGAAPGNLAPVSCSSSWRTLLSKVSSSLSKDSSSSPAVVRLVLGDPPPASVAAVPTCPFGNIGIGIRVEVLLLPA